jgi:hypothetical protein
MTKGKPWDINEVRQLHQLVQEGKGIEEISKIMVKTHAAIRQKMIDLKLKVLLKEQQQVVSGRKPCFCSSKLEIPADLPTIEEALQILAAALRKGAEAGLDKDEVQRLQVVATLAKTYKEFFADYVDYRGIEVELLEWKAKYAELAKKGPGVSS